MILCHWVLQYLAVESSKEITCIGRDLSLSHAPVGRVSRESAVRITAFKEKPTAVTVTMTTLGSAALMNHDSLITVAASVVGCEGVLLK